MGNLNASDLSGDPIPLLAAISRGDEQAMCELYDSYKGALYGVILRIVHHEAIAQEVLQDTFIKIWRNAGGYDRSKGRPFAWMVTIARNAAVDASRSAEGKRARSLLRLGDQDHSNEQNGSLPPMDCADLLSVLAGLRQEHRELIDLAYYKGYSQQEIANNIGLPLGTVKSRTRYALLELRTLLKDHY